MSFSVISHKGEVKGISWLGERKIYYIPAQGFVTGQYLCEKMTEVLEKADAAVTMNVKEQRLSYLHVEKKNLFDARSPCIFLNPLKDTYAYEDIAKECLDLLVPSVQEPLGKRRFWIGR